MAAGTLAAATLVNGRTAVDLTDGAAPTATDGDLFANSGREYLFVDNPESDTLTLAFDITYIVDGVTPTDKQVTVAASKQALIGPFPPGTYNDTNSKAKVTCSFAAAGALANVKLKVLKFA